MKRYRVYISGYTLVCADSAAESTDMQTSLSIGMNPKEINNAIPTNDT